MGSQVLDFLNQQQDRIIQNWIEGLEREYPQFYNLEEIRKHGSAYCQFIMDTDIPVENHPFLSQMAHLCQLLLKKNVPFIHTIRSSHIFRQSVIETFQGSHFDLESSFKTFSALNSRIDAYEIAVCHYYGEITRSELEEKERKLDELHEDKLNLIGKMAASMAHEIRNPLTSINGFLKLIRYKLPAASYKTIEKYVDIIESEFENIQMQISGFLSFSKKPVIEEPFVSLSINQIIDSVLLLINPRLINENIEISIEIHKDYKDLMIYAQKVAIQQVLSNLLNNSIDALTEMNSGKRIKIESKEDEHYIYICVINNGPEIPKEIQDNLFKPFVTSKMDGTGIGLTICKQIMSKNRGSISFASTSQETTFTLIFDKPKESVSQSYDTVLS